MIFDEYQAKVLRAFWQNGRRMFVPCTAADVSSRSGLNVTRAGCTLQEMCRDGMATQHTSVSTQWYELTETGSAAANVVLSVSLTTCKPVRPQNHGKTA